MVCLFYALVSIFSRVSGGTLQRYVSCCTKQGAVEHLCIEQMLLTEKLEKLLWKFNQLFQVSTDLSRFASHGCPLYIPFSKSCVDHTFISCFAVRQVPSQHLVLLSQFCHRTSVLLDGPLWTFIVGLPVTIWNEWDECCKPSVQTRLHQ